MAKLLWRRIAIGLVLAAAFSAYLVSILLRWDVPLWGLAVAGGVLLGALWFLARPTRPKPRAELTSSDAYTDLMLGRRPATSPFKDPSPTSQIGSALPEDPLALGDTRYPMTAPETRSDD